MLTNRVAAKTKPSAAARARWVGHLRRALVAAAAPLLVTTVVAFLLLASAHAPAYASPLSVKLTPSLTVLGTPALYVPSTPGTPPTSAKVMQVPILVYHLVDSTLPRREPRRQS